MLVAPGFVLVLGLALAFGATVAAYSFVTTAERARFEQLVASAQSSLNGRLDADADAVHAAAGLFAARGELTSAGFEAFVRHLSPAWRLRMRSVGWAEKRGDMGSFLVRHVHPSEPGSVDRVGRDLADHATVLEAMRRAAAIGEITSSEYVELDGRDEAGFFTFFPVYRAGSSLESVPERYDALRGFVFTTRDVDSLLHGIEVSPEIETTVLERSTVVEDGAPAREVTHGIFGPYAFEVVRAVRIGEREWPVQFRSTPVFAEGEADWIIVLTAIATLVLTALFTAITWLESRARAEAEQTNLRLAESEEALRRASRAKDEFLGVVSHELRNPLGAMAGALNILRLHRSLDDAGAQRALEIADRQVHQQARLVDDLLDVTRLATSNVRLDIEPVDVNDLVARVVADTRAAAIEHHHAVSFTPAHGPVVVDGDATRLSQIFSNLVHNSIKYTPDEGHIDVAVHREDGRAVITVRDDGAGIPGDLLEEVFTPFFQQRLGESASKGLGLGLTIAQRLVTLHGGAISASSAGSGHGSKFEVRLPLSQREAEVSPVRESPLPVEAGAQGERRALRAVVIDDMEDGREILEMLLHSLGLEIEGAGTGREGLELIDRVRPDVALIDIDLPDMPGFEVARRARQARGEDVVLVAVTGYSSKEDRAHAARAGFDDYLVKPVDVRQLRTLVDTIDAHGEESASSTA